MMRKTHSLIIFCGIILIFLIIAILLLTVEYNNEFLPDMASAQQTFIENRQNIQVVIDYMIGTGYENIYITTEDKMFADLSWVSIDDPIARAAVSQLVQSRVYIAITKRGNTIELNQWRGFRDIGCGMAYSINGIDSPDIMFATKLVPISDEGWFYYVYDYNTWRGETGDSFEGQGDGSVARGSTGDGSV